MFSPSSKIPGWDGSLVLLYQTRLRGECSGGSKAVIGGRRSVGLQERIDVHVIFFEAGAHALEGFVNGVSKLEHFVFLFVDGTPADHGFPIQHFIPILFAVNQDRKSTRLNSSHLVISYAVFCLKKKKKNKYLKIYRYKYVKTD